MMRTLVPLYFSPAPSLKTFSRFLKKAKIPRIKANPTALRGGGTAYYHVAAVERAIRERAGLTGAADYHPPTR